MRKKANKLLSVIFWAVLIVVLLGAILFRISDRKDKSLFGYRIYTIETNSMKTDKSISDRFKGESFERGDLIVVKLNSPESIKVGDIITFVPTGVDDGTIYLTHRVVQKNDKTKQFITKGDANNKNDPEISGKQIIGIVQCAIPFVGRMIEAIKNAPIVTIGVLLIFIVIVKHIKMKFLVTV